LFLANCGGCHSERGGGGYPNLWNLPPAIHEVFGKIVSDGLLSANGMASFANVLEPRDVTAIHAYLIEDARSLRAMEKHPTTAPAKRQR
jgi:quinohemoprotein ethanol dehydrogenase